MSALRERRREPDVSYWVQLLRQRYAGMKIVVGRDKLDEVQVGVFAEFLGRENWVRMRLVTCFLFYLSRASATNLKPSNNS